MQNRPTQPTARRNGERGVALLAVVAVLVLLAIIATPFLVTMRDGAARGKAVLASAEADMEAQNVFRVAVVHLGAGHDGVERYAKEEKLKGQPSTPDYDTLDELRIPEALLRSAGVDPESGRIWGVSVEDESSKININSAPFTVLGYYFGMTGLEQPLEVDATEAVLQAEGGLPARNGVVRLGDEVVRYQARDGTLLRGLQRGFEQGRPGNGPARKHAKGELVVNEVAFQVAAYPILARRGKVTLPDGTVDERTEFAPFSNLYEMRRISDLGVAALSTEQWERVVDWFTVSSRGVAGSYFGDPQTLRDRVKAGEDGHKARLRVENPQRFPIGTTIRVSDGTHTDYAVIYGYGGGANIEVVPALQHDYDAEITRVESLIRHPVNVNTAPVPVLAALHANIFRHGQKPLAPDAARIVAERIAKVRADEKHPGIRGLKEYRKLLDALVKEGVLQPEEATSCEMNALNPMETASTRLAIGTMPLAFRSCDVYTVTARAVVLDRTGKEVGRREFRRVVDVGPQGPAIYEVAGQAELDEVLRTHNAKHFTTAPINLGFEDRGVATAPPSRFTPFFRQDRWPVTDRTDPTAGLRLAPSRLWYGTGTDTFPEPLHFDESDYAEGDYLEEGGYSVSSKDGRVNIEGDDGMEPFAAGLWFKPYWGGHGTAFVLDTGLGEWEDRVGLFYDGGKREMVLRVKDTSLQHVAAEVRYPFDKSTWEDDKWYHLMVTVSGSEPGQASMIIDGVKRGTPTLLTYLTQPVPATGALSNLAVEDASSFPDKGALLLRGPEGVEVMEYDGKTTGGFRISRRLARMNRSDTTDDTSVSTSRSFPAGCVVTQYGYSIPMASVVPEGVGTLASTLGRFNVLVLNSTAPPDSWPPATSGGGGSSFSFATGWSGSRKTFTLDVGKDVSGWDGSPGSTAVQAFGSAGYALLVSSDFSPFYSNSTPERLMGCEVAYYEVNGGSISVQRGVEPPRNLHWTKTKYGFDKFTNNTALHFIPKHTYGDPNDPVSTFVKSSGIDPDGRIYRDAAVQSTGIISVMIPISVEVTGAEVATYLDPASQPDYSPRTMYAQIDQDDRTEWFKYDTVMQGPNGNVFLVRDRTADRIASLFRVYNVAIALAPPGSTDTGTGTGTGDSPPTPPPPPPPEDDGTPGDPGAPPTPPDPGEGGEEDSPPESTPEQPPLPPDPGGGGEEDGPAGAPESGPVNPPGGESGGGEQDGGAGDPESGPVMPPEGGGDGGEQDGGAGDPESGPVQPPADGGDDGGSTGGDTGGSPPTAPGDAGTPGSSGSSGSAAGSGTTTVLEPFNEGKFPHFIARFLDFRSSDTSQAVRSSNTAVIDIPVLIADMPARAQAHNGGTDVLPCLLVAFPGIEYDPQANGSEVFEKDLDDFSRQNEVGPPVGGAAAPGSSTTTGTVLESTTIAVIDLAATGDGIEPGDANMDGRFVEPGPGWNDVVTLVQPGDGALREEHTINHSFRVKEFNARYDYRYPTNAGFSRNWTFVAFKEPATRQFSWNYDKFNGTTAVAQAANVLSYLKGDLGDRRSFVRLVKSPSGEMPSRVAENVHIAANFEGGEFAKAVIDEVKFASPRSSALVNKYSYRLGAAPARGQKATGINPRETTIPVHCLAGYVGGLAPKGVRKSGGILRVDEELIGYSEYDTASQMFTNCERGAFGSEAKEHAPGATVSAVAGIGVSRLEEGISESSPKVVLADAHGFPLWGGFVRIGTEILGYNRIDQDVLQIPPGRRLKEDRYGSSADTDAGVGLFRGRFGTEAMAHEAGSLAYHLDTRYSDFVREKADHAQLAYFTVSRVSKGAMWKRVSWDQRLRPLVGVRVVVRFAGGPAWDSDKVVRLDTDPVPEKERNRWLYEISDPTKLNLLNVQSDLIECRVFFTYEKGAWNPDITPASDAWKETPWLKAFRMEYLAPAGVLTTEDLR